MATAKREIIDQSALALTKIVLLSVSHRYSFVRPEGGTWNRNIGSIDLLLLQLSPPLLSEISLSSLDLDLLLAYRLHELEHYLASPQSLRKNVPLANTM